MLTLKAWSKIDQFRSDSAVETWVVQICLNEALNERTRHINRHEVLDPHEFEIARNAAVNALWLRRAEIAPDQIVLNLAVVHLLEQALWHVTPLMREAVVLCDLEDLSYDELSEILNVSGSTIKMRIKRGRRAIKGKIPNPSSMSRKVTGSQAFLV